MNKQKRDAFASVLQKGLYGKGELLYL
jgi:hypothetical protein